MASGTPFVKGGFAEAASAVRLFDCNTCFGLFEDANDLLLGVSVFSNVRHSPFGRTSAFLRRYGFGGAGQRPSL